MSIVAADVRERDRSTGCWEWPGRCEWNGRTDPRGYGVFTLRGMKMRAHREAFRLAGHDIVGVMVLHSCDNPPCYNPDHLHIGTRAENNAERDQRGRHRPLRGSENPKAKLSGARVRRIRRAAASGQRQRDIAEQFGITQAAVSLVVRRVNWKHIA